VVVLKIKDDKEKIMNHEEGPSGSAGSFKKNEKAEKELN